MTFVQSKYTANVSFVTVRKDCLLRGSHPPPGAHCGANTGLIYHKDCSYAYEYTGRASALPDRR